jgi:hypothetical protein
MARDHVERMIARFGSADAFATDFLDKKTVEKILALPSGPGRDSGMLGAILVLTELENLVTNAATKERVIAGLETLTRTNPAQAAGRRKTRRLMSRKYCKKTPCNRMGFTQKASCRPYKNCYARRR